MFKGLLPQAGAKFYTLVSPTMSCQYCPSVAETSKGSKGFGHYQKIITFKTVVNLKRIHLKRVSV